MLKEQFQLALLDEERAIKALPKLLRRRARSARRAWTRCARSLAAPGPLDQEGKRRLARIETLLGVEALTPSRSGKAAQCLSAATGPAGPPHEKYDRLIAAAQKETTIKVAVAHPCDDVSLARSGRGDERLRLIEPILVGPVERMRGVAAQAELDISAMEIVDFGAQP